MYNKTRDVKFKTLGIQTAGFVFTAKVRNFIFRQNIEKKGGHIFPCGKMVIIMRKVVLYIAMSLDGYIADSSGKIDWLDGRGGDDESIDSYSEFIKGIDAVVMGFNTYDQIVTELSTKQFCLSHRLFYPA